MQGTWRITLDGKEHVVTATVPIYWSVLTVTVDGQREFRGFKWAVLGELHRFRKFGHEFVVKNKGWGYLGTLKLFVDGQDADSVGAIHPAQAVQSLKSESPEAIANLETQIVEVDRHSEPLGEDMRVIDNLNSSSPLVRKIMVSREWRKTVTVDHDETQTTGGGLDVKLPYALGLRASVDKAVKDRYSISAEDKRTYSEEVTLTANAKKRLTVTFMWKQVWQTGVVKALGPNGEETSTPYRVQLQPTFDQRQEEHSQSDEGPL